MGEFFEDEIENKNGIENEIEIEIEIEIEKEIETESEDKYAIGCERAIPAFF